jgi:hypothetical protein
MRHLLGLSIVALAACQGASAENVGHGDNAVVAAVVEPPLDGPEAACAEFAPNPEGVTMSGDTLCRVATGVSASGVLEMADGTNGSATTESGTLALTCSNDTATLMAAQINCYQGPGRYTIPKGMLMLSGVESDRPCTLDAYKDEGTIRGFISCAATPGPAAGASVFAFTQPPIGLGSYALPTDPTQ